MEWSSTQPVLSGGIKFLGGKQVTCVKDTKAKNGQGEKKI